MLQSPGEENALIVACQLFDGNFSSINEIASSARLRCLSGGPLKDASGEDRHDPFVMGVRCLQPACNGLKTFYRVSGRLRRWNDPGLDRLAGHRASLCSRDGRVEVLRWSDLCQTYLSV